MSYTSGRTVKGAKKTTPAAAATRDARKLVTAHLATITGVTINSRPDYDLTHNVGLVRTTITYPTGTDYRALAAAAEELPGHYSITPGMASLVITRTA